MRVVSVIINELKAADGLTLSVCDWKIPVLGKAPAYARKFGQPLHNRFVRDAHERGDCHGRQGVTHVVQPRQIQYHGQRLMLGP